MEHKKERPAEPESKDVGPSGEAKATVQNIGTQATAAGVRQTLFPYVLVRYDALTGTYGRFCATLTRHQYEGLTTFTRVVWDENRPGASNS